jgi:hypothetical protein
MPRYTLLGDCFLDGRRYKRGDIVDRTDNWRGPTITIPKTDPETGHTIFENGKAQRQDKPLYELIKEKEDKAHG